MANSQLEQVKERDRQVKSNLTIKQGAALDIIAKMSPEKFGVSGIYYRPVKNGLFILFVIKKDSRISLVSYLNSLADNLAESKNIQITSNVYYRDNKIAKDIIQDSKLEKRIVPRALVFA